MFSNELEKENTALFALGFSFADEHIQEITLRSANSNPTLGVFIVAYDEAAADQLRTVFPEEKCRHSNIFIIQPPMEAKEGEAPPHNTCTQLTISRSISSERSRLNLGRRESKLRILHEPQYCR